MAKETTPDGIIAEIYRAATRDAAWEDVLRMLTAVTGSNFSYFQEHDLKTGAVTRLLHDAAPLESIDDYVHYWSRRDPRLQYALRHPTAPIYNDYAIMGDESAIARNDFYNEYLASIDVRYMGATSLPMDNNGGLPPRIGYLGINRRQSAGHVDQRHCDIIQTLRPHFQQAMAIEARLKMAENEAETLRSALKGLEYGVAIVDETRTIRWMNDEALRILRDDAGFAIERGTLEATAPAQRNRLRQLVRGAVSTDGDSPGGSLLVGPEADTAVEAFVAPLPATSDPLPDTRYSSRYAVVFLHERDRRRTSLAPSQQELYGLTPAEARLANALANGYTLKQAAELLHTTHESARTYIKRIYAKTGTNTQAQLVRILLNGPANRVR